MSLAEAAQSDAARRPRPWWPKWVVVVAVLLGLLAVLGWWITHPDALLPAGNKLGSPVRVGETHVLDIIDPLRPITIRSIEPYRLEGAEAKVVFRACRYKPGWAMMVPKVRACDGQRDVRGVVIGPHPSGTEWEIRAEVTLLEEGYFSMQGFVVEYREGLRWGRQVTDVHAVVFSPGHEPPPSEP